MVEALALTLLEVALLAATWVAAPVMRAWAVLFVWAAASGLSIAIYTLGGPVLGDGVSAWLSASVLLCGPLALIASLRTPGAPIWLTLPAALLGVLTLPLLVIGALVVACNGGPGVCPS
jgi:hypothetical protein